MIDSMDMPVIPTDSLTSRDKLLKLAEDNNSNGKSVSKQKKQTVKSLKSKNYVSKVGNNNGQQDLSFTSNIEHLVVRSSTPIAGRVPSFDGDNISSEFATNYIYASHPSSRNGSPTKSQMNDSPAHQTQQQHSYLPQVIQQSNQSLATPVLFSTNLTESCLSTPTTPTTLTSTISTQTAAVAAAATLKDDSINSTELMFANLKIDNINRNHSNQYHKPHQHVPFQSQSAGKNLFGSRIPNLRSSSNSSSNTLRTMNDFGPLNRWPETEDLSKHSNHRRLFVENNNELEHVNASITNPQKSNNTNIFTNMSTSRIPILINNSTNSRINSCVHQQMHTSIRHYSTGIQRNDIHQTSNPFQSGHNFYENGSKSRLFKSKTSDSFISDLSSNHGQNILQNSSKMFDFSSPITAVRVFEHNQFDPSWFPVITATTTTTTVAASNDSDLAANMSKQTSTITTNTNNMLPNRCAVLDSNFVNRRISTPLRPNRSLDGCSLGFISTPDQSLYEKFFLRETQKNALATIAQNQKFNRSASCESFELFQQQTLADSHHNNNVEQNRNELNGLTHLEEEQREEDSILNRFRKSFSLRFSKSNQCSTNEKGDESSFENDIKAASPYEQSENTSHSKSGDINQNTIFRTSTNESNFVRVSTIERRKSRYDPFGRKSLRRSSRKSFHLKRSTSQPTDKLLNDVRSPNDLSFDSSDVESCKSPTILIETCSTTDLNDSHEKSEDVIYAEAIWDYTKSDAEELTFKAGDLIDVTDTSNKEWWWGAVTKDNKTQYGWFPATYVRLKVSQEETIEEVLAKSIHEDDEDAFKRMSMSKMSSEQVRSNIVLEIINSERDFVKNLTDVIDGYLKPCRDRQEMFSQIQIQTIFGNIEELHRFATQLLADLEKCVNWNSLSTSEIGNCFWNNEKAFSVYCDFCKNHPLAISELQDLYTDHRYIVFFEGCRLLQNMIDISLDGFLLTPIQKICKYPLQLGELLKHTRTDHPDYEPIQKALEAMQRVAQLVNDRKRRFESLEQLIALQDQFENWEGLPLIDSSSLLIHTGEVTRITSGSWSKDITLMLFDHLLILCKKDSGLLKKCAYIFKSRIEMDDIDEVVSLEDNIKDPNFNVSTKNAFKFFYKPLQKWYLFQTKTIQEKNLWLEAFVKERKHVQDDKDSGFFVSESDKRGALISRQNNLKLRKPRSNRASIRPTTSTVSKAKKPDTVIADLPLGPILDRNRAGSLPSYIHYEVNGACKHRQSTMHKKNRSNWFQLGSSKKKPTRLKRNLK